MKWIERCPDCGAIDLRGTLKHVFRAIRDKKYRQTCLEAELFWLAFCQLGKPDDLMWGDTIHIPRLERITKLR